MVSETDFPEMSGGDPTKMILPRRYHDICSLEDIIKILQFMRQPIFRHDNLVEGMSDEEIKKIPFAEKKWGINHNVIIEPLSEDMEESYIDASEEGFYGSWRQMKVYTESKV